MGAWNALLWSGAWYASVEAAAKGNSGSLEALFFDQIRF